MSNAYKRARIMPMTKATLMFEVDRQDIFENLKNLRIRLIAVQWQLKCMFDKGNKKLY